MKPLIDKFSAHMEQSVVHLRAELTKIRTGRASLALLEDVKVDAYGSMMTLHQVASLSVPEPRLMAIAPWDASLVQAIEKAILQAQLGLTPNNDGKIIRIPVPALTEERRKELSKVVRRMGEDSKVAIRNIRRDANEALKTSEKEGAAEDDVKRAQQEIQKSTDAFIAKVDDAVTGKEKEIMTV